LSVVIQTAKEIVMVVRLSMARRVFCLAVFLPWTGAATAQDFETPPVFEASD
jgi:ligand-binding SRPBCC domain-containing protein